MDKIITEITPLTEQDSFYLMDHKKERYDYPLHKHPELELTFMENCTGVQRVVGDSIEVCGQYDLALIGSNLEHAWEQRPDEVLVDVAAGKKVREYIIQFSPDLLGENFLSKSQMATLAKLFENAKRGITVNCVSPGMVAVGEVGPTPGTWIGRQGSADEMARAIVFLAADESGFITGADLPVDGGRILGPHGDDM